MSESQIGNAAGAAPEPDRQAVEALFDDLLDRPAREREARLADETLEAEVRERVRELLAAVDDPPPDLDRPLVDPISVHAAALPETLGPYAIEGVLGSGGMGVVYRARQQAPSRAVAVKLMRPSLGGVELARRFAREAELLGRLQHPGIAQIFEAGVEERQGGAAAYIAMELVEGVPLADFAEEQHLDQRQRVALLIQLSAAVHHAHLRGVIHRDLKPSNVLVTPEGVVKVIDFGVARASEAEAETLDATQPGQVLGTLAYMSPEQVSGPAAELDARTDVYSLGVIAYELLAGELPHALDGLTLASAARVLVEREAPRLGRVAPDCRGDLEWIVGRALEKERDRRYQSASALQTDLARWTRHEPVEARPASAVYQLQRLARRHRGATLGLAGTLLALVLGIVATARFALENKRLAESASEARAEALAQAELATDRAVEAERLQRLAEERAAEIVRRTDPARLDQALEEFEGLWPMLPSTVPAMDAWLAELAEPLAANLPLHREALERLRAEALPYGPQDARLDRESHPQLSRVEELRLGIERMRQALAEAGTGAEDPSGELAAKFLSTAEPELAELEARLDERRTWRFADPRTQEVHDNLAVLVERLEAFVADDGSLAKLRERRSLALRLAERTTTDPLPAAQWAEAIEAIRSSPAYGGLELAPQPGLIPLREDPHSGLWEFWHLESGVRPVLRSEPSAPNAWAIDGATGLVLVLIPGGTYRVGAQAEDPGAPHYDPWAASFEGPVRAVDLSPYFISKYELTLTQWSRFAGEVPNGQGHTFVWRGEPPGEQVFHANTRWNPVEDVSWVEAKEILRRMALRLPTADEWEAAARGRTSTPWWSGREPASLADVGLGLPAGNLADSLSQERGSPPYFQTEAWPDEWLIHAPVGSFPPGPFGLHDTVGNVNELCADRGIPGAPENAVVVKGGSYDEGARQARSAYRGFVYDTDTVTKLGVRPARSVH